MKSINRRLAFGKKANDASRRFQPLITVLSASERKLKMENLFKLITMIYEEFDLSPPKSFISGVV